MTTAEQSDLQALQQQAEEFAAERKALEETLTELRAELEVKAPSAQQRVDAKLKGEIVTDNRRPAADVRADIAVCEQRLERIKQSRYGLRDAICLEIRKEYKPDHEKIIQRLMDSLDAAQDAVECLEAFEAKVRREHPEKPKPGSPWRAWRDNHAISELQRWKNDLEHNDGPRRKADRR